VNTLFRSASDATFALSSRECEVVAKGNPEMELVVERSCKLGEALCRLSLAERMLVDRAGEDYRRTFTRFSYDDAYKLPSSGEDEPRPAPPEIAP